MIRKPLQISLDNFPDVFHPLLEGCTVYDSSCSSTARVFFLQKEEGLFLKTAQKGTLQQEAALTRFFHSKGLAAEVLVYQSLDRDWLLTRQLTGEDCTFEAYLADPIRLCDTTASLLRELHSVDSTGCPAADRTAGYLSTARKNYKNKVYDESLFPDNWGYSSAEEAWKVLERDGKFLKADVLLHGDYCLPNILLDHWKFSGFIDLGGAGIGDRHIDLFWGIWSLGFNLKTDRYKSRFLDVYGRADINEELFRVIAAAEVFG